MYLLLAVNVNVMVFDTEMYSNTGGQSSKASNIGEVCQFAAAVKRQARSHFQDRYELRICIRCPDFALGANPAQAVKAITEAEAYPGPSLIIGYAPCKLHGIAKGGMNHCQDEMKKAVKAGYWNLFSFNPALKAEGKNPFTLTSKAGDGSYQEFLNNRGTLYSSYQAIPEREQRNSLLSLRRQLRHVIHTLRNSLNYTERTNSLSHGIYFIPQGICPVGFLLIIL